MPPTILVTTRISEVLETHPACLQVLLDASPAFHKLKNPVLRKVMPRLVTVQQAAGIAGLDAQVLLDALRQAAGVPLSPEHTEKGETMSVSMLDTPPPEWIFAPLAAELDVRALLEQGQEPFKHIQKASAKVPEGSRLLLIAPFEPIPLYQALGRQGFEPWCSQHQGTYEVHFYRSGVPWTPPVQVGQTAPISRSFDQEIHIPETLEPPEPMMRILAALDRLPAGKTLLVHHVRRPVYLLQRLEDLGFRTEVQEQGSEVKLWIQKG